MGGGGGTEGWETKSQLTFCTHVALFPGPVSVAGGMLLFVQSKTGVSLARVSDKRWDEKAWERG